MNLKFYFLKNKFKTLIKKSPGKKKKKTKLMPKPDVLGLNLLTRITSLLSITIILEGGNSETGKGLKESQIHVLNSLQTNSSGKRNTNIFPSTFAEPA